MWSMSVSRCIRGPTYSHPLVEIRKYHTEWKEVLLVQGVGVLTSRLVVGEQKKGLQSVENLLSKVIHYRFCEQSNGLPSGTATEFLRLTTRT